MIEGVVVKNLVAHHDERGYFQEIIRSTDEFFSPGFGQWSMSKMYQNTIKAWHIHRLQHDFWYIANGVVKAVLCDLRPISDGPNWAIGAFQHKFNYEFDEYTMGDNCPPIVLCIPPGVAHGLKVLQGPATLFYITSKVYDPNDEGRIEYRELKYDWDARVIK